MKPTRQQTFRKFTAYILLAAVSFFFAPKELIHDFFHDHNDTSDVITHNGTGEQVENEHQHCDILQLSVPPIIHDVNHFSFTASPLLCTHSVEHTCSYHFASSAFLFFRGPPDII